MQNDLLPKSSEENSLLRKLLNQSKNLKKSLIRTMAGLSTAAVLLTGTACDTTQLDTTTPVIDKVTEDTHQSTEPVETNSVETEPIQIEQKSDLAKELYGVDTYKQYEDEYNAYINHYNGKSLGGGYGLSFSPINYDYFRNLFPNKTDEELLDNVCISFYAISDNDLYIAFTAMANLGSDKLNVNDRYISLFKYADLDDEIIEELKKENSLDLILLLNYVVSNNIPELLAQNLNNYNKMDRSYVQFYVNGLDKENSEKECFYFEKKNNNIEMHVAEVGYGSQEDIDLFNKFSERESKLPALRINEDDQLRIEKICDIDYMKKYSANFNNTFKYNITP